LSTSDRQTSEAPVGPVRYVVARTGDIPDGQRLVTEVGGRKIGVFNVKGKFYALLHRCPHAHGPLCDGLLQKRVYAEKPGLIRDDPNTLFLSCPWHGWLFDLDTGQSWWDPGKTRARRFPVEVTHGDVIAERLSSSGAAERQPGPYVAEVYPVEVEDDYIVVTLRPRQERSATDASL
jgi:nitrite reductase/ring-hydroxylating ferredoxin subunit